ncbi:MAG: hypoxanthine phosphoribosyltransferase [Erysipelotrichaceae bacterium]|jgi:hypoxanthine phosphoribosyltransferase|nr:hypoxanthine phosphoribosyltransferase [Erysipelotrichaceae bacterium]MDO5108300.1 hypoxanthine phosphoribosyltransferase [Erysipelotrichaceae bacterium]
MWAEKDVEKILVTEEQITAKAAELGRQITEDYARENSAPLLVALLRGSVPFFAELAKRIDLDVEYDFMDVSSYVGRHSGGEIRILKDLDTSVRDRDVLLVEDIVDTGKTIQAVIELLYHRGARSVKIVTLLDKPSGRTNHLHADYIGFEVGNEFVVGFGMDFNQKYRTLPFIGVLKPECYESKE